MKRIIRTMAAGEALMVYGLSAYGEAMQHAIHEIRREFSPTGVLWTGKHSDTANMARDAGLPVRDSQWLLGMRDWW